jgi:hypothetical protein
VLIPWLQVDQASLFSERFANLLSPSLELPRQLCVGADKNSKNERPHQPAAKPQFELFNLKSAFSGYLWWKIFHFAVFPSATFLFRTKKEATVGANCADLGVDRKLPVSYEGGSFGRCRWTGERHTRGLKRSSGIWHVTFGLKLIQYV